MVYTGPLTTEPGGFSYVVETDIRDETAEDGWIRESTSYRSTLPFWSTITEAGSRPTERCLLVAKTTIENQRLTRSTGLISSATHGPDPDSPAHVDNPELRPASGVGREVQSTQYTVRYAGSAHRGGAVWKSCRSTSLPNRKRCRRIGNSSAKAPSGKRPWRQHSGTVTAVGSLLAVSRITIKKG